MGTATWISNEMNMGKNEGIDSSPLSGNGPDDNSQISYIERTREPPRMRGLK